MHTLYTHNTHSHMHTPHTHRHTWRQWEGKRTWFQLSSRCLYDLDPVLFPFYKVRDGADSPAPSAVPLSAHTTVSYFWVFALEFPPSCLVVSSGAPVSLP